MTNIAHVIERYYPIVGGAENQCRNLIYHLNKKEIRSIVITRRFNELNKNDCIDGNSIYRISKINKIYKGKLSYINSLIFFILPLIYTIYKKRNNIQVIHFHGASDLYGVIAWVSKFWKIKSVAKVASSRQREAGDIRAAFMGRIRVKLIDGFDRIIAISNELKNCLLQEGYNKDKVVCIPNGVDIEKFFPLEKEEKQKLKLKLNLNIDKNYIIFSGRLITYKNIPLLIRAYSELILKYNMNYDLLIIGDGKLQTNSVKKEVENMIEVYNMGSRIHLTGEKENISEYYQLSNIFVLPSTQEGLPNSLLEAMACGLSCIGSNIGGIQDLIIHKRTGLLFESNNIEALKEAIYELCHDPNLQDKLSTEAVKFVNENYSFNTITSKFNELYNKLRQEE